MFLDGSSPGSSLMMSNQNCKSSEPLLRNSLFFVWFVSISSPLSSCLTACIFSKAYIPRCIVEALYPVFSRKTLAARPVGAIRETFLPSPCSSGIRLFIIVVLPVPAYPFRIKMDCSLSFAKLIMQVKASFCCSVNSILVSIR